MDDVVIIGDLDQTGAPKSDVVTIADDAASPLPKNATLNADGTVTLTLGQPVVLKWRKPGGEVTEDEFKAFTFRRLTGKDMMVIQAAGRDMTGVVAIAQSASIPMAKFRNIYERMDGADINAAGEVVSYFLAPGTSTGT